VGIVVSANAKLLLLGEHAAVYGAPAIGVGLPWPLTLTYEPGGSDWHLPGMGPHEALLRRLLEHFASAVTAAGVSPLPVGRLEVSSQVPLAAGFGSSGALCAALSRLHFPLATLDELDLHAWEAEKLFHGTPSGIDTALALRSGWWSLLPGRTPPAAQALSSPAHVLLTGAVHRRSDTKTLVGSLAERRKRGDRLVVDSLEALAELAKQAVAGWGPTTTTPLVPLIGQARSHLQNLGLETAELARVLDAGLAQGATAGKLSGAGGGGAWLLMFDTLEAALAAVPYVTNAIPPGEWSLRPRVVEL
jgi:mevalonate kinase